MEHFIVFSTGWNCAKYVKQHMESVNNQSYTNYTTIIVDDASTDNTWEEINKYKTDRCLIYRNTKNVKHTANMVNHLKPNVENDDVVVILDLDDWFAHENVLTRLNEIYSTENCWITYGHYVRTSGKNMPIGGYPPEVIKNRSFRKHSWMWHHLKSFKGFLFHNIDIEDFKGPDGNFSLTNPDLPIGFPMLEMTPPEKLRYIPEILLLYNADNPLMECRTYKKFIKPNTRHFRNKPKYDRLKDVL